MSRTLRVIKAAKNCFAKFFGQDMHVMKFNGWGALTSNLLVGHAFPPKTFPGQMSDKPLTFDVPQKNIILPTIDYWLNDDDFLYPKSERQPTAIEKFKKQIQHHGDKNFYVLTTCPFLGQKQFFLEHSNVKIIYWADEYALMPLCDMENINPISEKKFATDHHWIYLCRTPRFLRLISALFLLGFNARHTGLIRAPKSGLAIHRSWQGLLDFIDYNQLDFCAAVDSEYATILQAGFERFQQGKHYVDNSDHQFPYTRYPQTITEHPCDKENFNTHLRNYYIHTAVEIIAEPQIVNPGIITEKYINSVYGFNFPIIIGHHGSVQHLQKQGFDLFDDVIDHSYDTIQDPIIRIFSAIHLNKSILENRELAITRWTACQDRFLANVAHIEHIYKTIADIVTTNIEKSLLENV